MLSDFKVYCKALTIKLCNWNKSKNMKQWNRMESLCINLHKLFIQAPRIYAGEKICFNKQCWKNWKFTCKKKNVIQRPLLVFP